MGLTWATVSLNLFNFQYLTILPSMARNTRTPNSPLHRLIGEVETKVPSTDGMKLACSLCYCCCNTTISLLLNVHFVIVNAD